jgi:hypothetical protein
VSIPTEAESGQRAIGCSGCRPAALARPGRRAQISRPVSLEERERLIAEAVAGRALQHEAR